MSATYLRSCAQKKRHQTREEAMAHRRQLAGKKGVRLDRYITYRCIQCGTWHVAHAASRRSP